VGRTPRDPHLGAQGAVAAALDGTGGRLAQHGEVTGEPLRVMAQDAAEPAEIGVDLLVVVEDPGDVAGRRPQARRQGELDRDAALHVHGPAAPEHALAVHLTELRGEVALDRHRVEVAGDHHALRPAEGGAGDDRVAVTQHLEVRAGPQRHLDGVRQPRLIAAHRRDVAHRAGEVRDVRGHEVGQSRGRRRDSGRRLAAGTLGHAVEPRSRLRHEPRAGPSQHPVRTHAPPRAHAPVWCSTRAASAIEPVSEG